MLNAYYKYWNVITVAGCVLADRDLNPEYETSFLSDTYEVFLGLTKFFSRFSGNKGPRNDAGHTRIASSVNNLET
jgi:hypothetical protein